MSGAAAHRGQTTSKAALSRKRILAFYDFFKGLISEMLST